MKNNLFLKVVGISVLVGPVSVVSSVYAADSEFAGIEEVIVTAQKREATLQDTPVAVSAESGDTLKQKGIAEIQDLELAVPSLNVTQSATSSQQVFSIRGIGTSGFNAGLEPSVGVFIDGVYRARAASAIDDFIAVERVEVLRGPQSTVFGKNTPAGVISIITKKPSQEFGFDIEQTFGNFGSEITRGTVTGGITDSVSFRLSGNSNQRDGLIDNLQPGRSDVNDRDRYALRGQLLIEPTDELSIRIIADTSSITEACCGAPFFFNLPSNVAALESIGATIPSDDIFDRDIRFDGLLDTDQDQSGLSVQVDWEGDYLSFSSLTSYRDFEEENDLDADFVDVDLSGRRFQSIERDVFTQEFRVQSNGGDSIDWMVGYYYFDSDQDFVAATPYGADLRGFAEAATGGPLLLAGIEGFLNLAPGTFFAEGDGLVRSDFGLRTTSHSVFGQVDWHINDRLTVSGGLRWSTEDKEADAIIDVQDPFSALDLSAGSVLDLFIQQASGGLANGPALTPLQFNPPAPDFDDDRTESQTTGNFIVAYELNDDISVYASVNRGYKAGGFNLTAGGTANGSTEFSREIVDSWEVGAKARWLDNRLQTNVAVFTSRLRDFQTNAFNGTTFTLINAGRTEIDGIEFEVVYVPNEHWLLSFGGTYLDATYGSFEQGPATIAQGLLDQDFQDLSGEDVLGVPDWTLSSSLSYTQNFGPVDGFFNVAARYRGSRSAIGSLEPIADQSSYVVTNATIGIGDAEGLWTVSLWANNLFDEEYTDIVFNSIAQAGSFNAFPGDPRTYGVTLRVKY